jgi:hypothetical protein
LNENKRQHISLFVLTVGVMGLLDYFMAFMKIKGLYVHTFYKASIALG